jgi:probable phosphomutase (TIGR03848 family)
VITLLLIRHGMCDPVGHAIAGRTPGVHLNEEGRRSAAALAETLAAYPILAVHSSPLERAVETAQPLAARVGVPVELAPTLTELDFGAWTGRTLEELRPLPGWRIWNEARGSARIPGGESMAEVLSRALEWVESARHRPHEGIVAAVTHGDVIRALLTHFLEMPVDRLLRLEVEPASVSVIRWEGDEPRLFALNWGAAHGPTHLA